MSYGSGLQEVHQFVVGKQRQWYTNGQIPSAHVRTVGKSGLIQELQSDERWIRQHICPWLDTPEHRDALKTVIVGAQIVADTEWVSAVGILLSALEAVCHRRSPLPYIVGGAGAAGLLLWKFLGPKKPPGRKSAAKKR